jgi:hypothetical protein
MYSIEDNSVPENCWSALKCIFNIPNSEISFCQNLCFENACLQIIRDTCPDMLYFPNVPVFFGHIYFAFRKNNSTIEDIGLLYICYNNSRYDALFNMTSKVIFNNKTCFVHETISDPSTWSNLWGKWRDTPLQQLYKGLKKYQLIFNYTSAICNRLNMYQCMNSSKCISIHRLMDNIDDCPYMDDENILEINNTDVIEQLKQTHITCETSNKYIHKSLIKNGDCNCGKIEFDWCDDEDWGSFNFRKQISFQTICDGFVELTPIIINGQNETDETECEQWECNNLYTNCNKLWNCPNGADEILCSSRPSLNCSLNDHICVSPQTNQFICLPISKANDGKIDCLGAYDEPMVCRLKLFDTLGEGHFYCMNPTTQSCVNYMQLCDNHKDCEDGNDEQFCTTNRTPFEDRSICAPSQFPFKSDVEQFLCYHLELPYKDRQLNFLIDKMNMLDEHSSKNIENRIFSSSSLIQMSDQYQTHCHRGLDLIVWLNNKTNLTTMKCLCPSSFYGDRCQYQNQRISLTIKFRALSNSWQTLFAIIISLIDDSDQRIIHSYAQFTYLSVRNCKSRYNIYLVYSTRPKDLTKNYSIHIDIYEKVSLAYRGSLLLPINFPFLPVHRLGFIVDIPRKNDKTESCSNDQCIHGKCIRYSNNLQDVTFCQCDQGWSGRYCTIQHTCMCSSDSLCIGISANNRSICVCPMNKFGPRCLLVDPICQINNNLTCQNRGQCISNYDYIASDQNFICICQNGFSGDRCEIADKKLILSFAKDIVLSQSIFIHFIDLSIYNELIRTTTFRTIPVRPDLVIINWTQPFHLVFLELMNKNYYFIVLQETYNRSTTITKMVNSSNHCPHISELFNKTFIQWHVLRRIKYYHLPCQRYSPDLSCFYDDVHFCLCYNFGQKRLANCFNFVHNMTFDCIGQSECENGAQCFQDHLTCPYRSMCMCPSCFYGARCQFSTSGFGLSLDAILGYHILPHISIIHQSSIVQFSLAFTIIFVVAGLINGIFCLITFKNKIVREVGCGLYLLSSSIIVLLTIMMFGLKFFILLLAQMTIISNRSFLSFQCHSIDFILRVCLSMDQWLSACVAVERAITAIKGLGFVKKKSRQAAKLVIVILLIVIVGTCIHDPIYRRLINEENEDDDQKRIWCIVTYPSSLQIYNYIIHIVHFFGPFMINLISPVILIIKTSHHQSNVHQERTYKEILHGQFREHRHLLTAPIVLVILALPRLIITFVSKCMNSTGDAWLFLVGYFISFIPSMLTFIVFISPSKFYRKEFHKSITQYRTIIQRRLHLIP